MAFPRGPCNNSVKYAVVRYRCLPRATPGVRVDLRDTPPPGSDWHRVAFLRRCAASCGARHLPMVSLRSCGSIISRGAADPSVGSFGTSSAVSLTTVRLATSFSFSMRLARRHIQLYEYRLNHANCNLAILGEGGGGESPTDSLVSWLLSAVFRCRTCYRFHPRVRNMCCPLAADPPRRPPKPAS